MGITKERHIEEHEQLHKELDRLIADFVSCTKFSLGETPIMKLMQWSNEQTTDPVLPGGQSHVVLEHIVTFTEEDIQKWIDTVTEMGCKVKVTEKQMIAVLEDAIHNMSDGESIYDWFRGQVDAGHGNADQKAWEEVFN